MNLNKDGTIKKLKDDKRQKDEEVAQHTQTEEKPVSEKTNKPEEKELVIYFNSGHPLAVTVSKESAAQLISKLTLAMRCCGLAQVENTWVNGRNIAFFQIN